MTAQTLNTSVSVGIIGCGEVAGVHAANIITLGGRILACCDVDESRAQAFAKKFGAELATTDARKVFHNHRVDAVYICTHHDSHLPLALVACDARKAIFMEKPLALTIPECEEICTVVERSGVPFFMGFKMRFYPMVERAKSFLPTPQILSAQMMDTRWADGFWANDPKRGGGNVLSEGVHTFDLLCYLAEAKPVRIYAEGRNFHHPRNAIIDGIVATLAFDNGAVASVTQGDLGHPALVSKLSFQLFDGVKSAHLFNRLKSAVLYDGEESQTWHDPEEIGYLEESRIFLDCVRNGIPTPCNHLAGWRATMIAQKAFEAVASGQPQDLSGMW